MFASMRMGVTHHTCTKIATAPVCGSTVTTSPLRSLPSISFTCHAHTHTHARQNMQTPAFTTHITETPDHSSTPQRNTRTHIPVLPSPHTRPLSFFRRPSLFFQCYFSTLLEIRCASIRQLHVQLSIWQRAGHAMRARTRRTRRLLGFWCVDVVQW